MRQIVLDTETTGLHITEGHRIIEIGCIELIDRKFTGKRFHKYINPQRDVDEGALAVHGISNQFLLDKPTFVEIAPDFIEFVSGAELIIHNAVFDVGFINHEFSLTNQKYKTLLEYCRVVDTLVMARQLHVGQRNGLDALCKRYNIDNSQRELHGALLDAHLLAQVYLAMTGGQSSLFEEQLTVEVEKEVLSTTIPLIKTNKLRIINASPEELALHEKQLQKMAQKGKCLWLGLEKYQ